MPQLEEIIKKLQCLKIISTDEASILLTKQECTSSITPRTVGPRKQLLMMHGFLEDLIHCVNFVIQKYKNDINKLCEEITIQKGIIKNLSNKIIEANLTIEQRIESSNDTIKAINSLTDSSKLLHEKKNKLLQLKELKVHEIFPDILFVEVYQENILNRDIEEIETPYVLRFGVKVDLIKALAGTALSIELHLIEKQLINFAHKWLQEQPTVDFSLTVPNNNYLNNVVVIDIFARDRNKGICKITEDGMPETHTIAIWKKSNNKYLLIDPTNVQYSNFLVKGIKEITAYDVEYSKHEEDWFYRYTANNEKEKPGYSKPYDYPQRARDCVDIAVKIGFELGFLQKNYKDLELDSTTKIEELMRLKLSNSRSCALYLPYSGIIYRPSHDSNATERNNAYLQLMRQSPFFSKLKNK